MPTDRTILPSAGELARAHRRGEVVVSPELVGLGALAAGVAAVWLMWPAALDRLTAYMGQSMTTAAAARDAASALARATEVMVDLAVPVMAAALAGALVSGVAQARGLFPLGHAAGSGGQAVLPWGLARLGRAGVLLAAGAGLIWASWRILAADLFQHPAQTPLPALEALQGAASYLIRGLLLLLVMLAALDYLARKLALRQVLARTPAEARRDIRERQGDPSRRQERRRLHREVLYGGLLAVRSRARLVVTGPGLAVALEYRQGEMAAPRVLFKARGEGTAPLLRTAWEATVPVMHRPDLAAALETLGQGRPVPGELYADVAQALSLS